MDFLSLLFAYATPFVVVVVAALLTVCFAGATLATPRLLVYPYLGVLFWVTGNTYGRMDAVASSLYSRGSGVLYFPALLWLLFAAMLWSICSASFARYRRPTCNLLPWYLGFVVLLVAHMAVGLATGVPLEETISPAGFSNIIWMAALIITVLYCFRSDEQFAEFSKFIVIVGTARAVFGLIRWVGFGGDPANAYQNRHGLDLKLTFFDINDSLVCWLALAIAAIQLFGGRQSHSSFWRIVLWGALVSCLLCIVLSFRRTAWLGMLIAGAFILLQLPAKTRGRALTLAGPAVLTGILFSAWKRLSQTKGAGGLEGFFFDIQSRAFGAESSRLLELKLVAADIFANPLFGIGSWGRYAGHELISWQTGEYGGTFVHSGVLHVALKSGLIGVALCLGLIVAVAKQWKSVCMTPYTHGKVLAIAGISGALFAIPDLIIGTPVPQVRTMQMIALCVALPYLVRSAVVQSTPPPSSSAVYGSATKRLPT